MLTTNEISLNGIPIMDECIICGHHSADHKGTCKHIECRRFFGLRNRCLRFVSVHMMMENAVNRNITRLDGWMYTFRG